MKIAIVTEYIASKNKAYYGGVDSRTINLAKYLTKNNEVHIITSFTDGGERSEDYNGIKIHRIGKKRKFTQRGDFLQRLKFNSEVIEEISNLKPDIIDASGFVSWAGCSKAAKKIGIPSVATVHEVWQNEWIQNMGFINGLVGHFLEKRYLNDDFSRYISVSNFTKEKLINKIGINKNKIAVVYNGIDLDIFKKTTIDEKYPNPTIVTISRLVPYKRIDDLIRAIKILTSDFPDIKLKIIGKGSQENYLKNLSKNLGIQNNIDFVGKINDKKDLIEILKKSHIFALPSITEGFGIVIIEAIAAGIPYVASDIPSIREVTNSGIGGLLFKPKDYEDLSSKIKILLTDKSKQIEVMKNVNEHLKKYDWNNLACELEDWYKKTFLEFNK